MFIFIMRSQTGSLFISFSGLAAIIAVTLLAVLAGSLPHSDKVAVLFPPWWSADRAFEAAGTAGRVMGLGRLPSMIIVHGDPSVLSVRLRAAGALLIFDSSLSAGCRAAQSEFSS